MKTRYHLIGTLFCTAIVCSMFLLHTMQAYAEETSGEQKQRSAMYYKLIIHGSDTSYLFDTNPNRYLVYQKKSNGLRLREFILVGASHKTMKEMHPSETKELYVQYNETQRLRMPDGTIKKFPVLIVMGDESVRGVGGEVLYYR